MEKEIAQLKKQIIELQKEMASLRSVATLPLDVERALTARGFFKLSNPLGTGVLYSSNGVISTVTGDSAGVYVATISGGSPTNFMSVSNGIVTVI